MPPVGAAFRASKFQFNGDALTLSDALCRRLFRVVARRRLLKRRLSQPHDAPTPLGDGALDAAPARIGEAADDIYASR